MASPSPLSHIRNARGKLLEAVAELDEIIRMEAEPGVMQMRAPWAAAEIAAAFAEIGTAQAQVAEKALAGDRRAA